MTPTPSISVRVDLTNPGQFFACCGLLELADRLSPGAEGWFDRKSFHIAGGGSPAELLSRTVEAELVQLDPADDVSSPMRLARPFDLVLDWWTDEIGGGRSFKGWAGRMNCVRIARAMQKGMGSIDHCEAMFDHSAIVYDTEQPSKKVEPFYFDSRRGWNARSIDVGFAPDALNLKTHAFPAVEFLCLVGLARHRPAATDRRRVFDYHPWTQPLPLSLTGAAASGSLPGVGANGYRFENAFRTDQKKHKSFLPATLLGES